MKSRLIYGSGEIGWGSRGRRGGGGGGGVEKGDNDCVITLIYIKKN